MCNWDRNWKRLIENNRILLNEYMRYMDDGRSMLPAIKPGWRWSEGRLCYTARWWKEDKDKTGIEITSTILGQSMQEVYPFLKFTTEVGEGEGGWLPTLDVKLRVEDNNIISYQFYEKPTTTNTMVPKRSALNENSKMQILANDLVRRLSHTDVRQEYKTLGEVIDQFGHKILTSGYSLTQTRKIILDGLRGWDRKRTKRLEDKGYLFRTNKESLRTRIEKKLVGKTSWFKSKRLKKDKRPTEEDKHENTE